MPAPAAGHTNAGAAGSSNAGAAAIVAFIAIRATNIYGDPAPRKAQAGGGFALRTVASFIHTTKNPPSLVYVPMTLAPALLLLRWFEKR